MPNEIADIVVRAQKGEPQAFGELYEAFAPLVRMVCLDQTQDWSVTLDLTQEVFIIVLRRIASLREAHRFRSWLLGITRHTIRDHRKKQGRYGQRFSEIDSALSYVEFETHQLDAQRQLRMAIRALSEQERIVICLFHFEGKTVREIVRLMDMPQRTAYAILGPAHDRLKRHILNQERTMTT